MIVMSAALIVFYGCDNNERPPCLKGLQGSLGEQGEPGNAIAIRYDYGSLTFNSAITLLIPDCT